MLAARLGGGGVHITYTLKIPFQINRVVVMCNCNESLQLHMNKTWNMKWYVIVIANHPNKLLQLNSSPWSSRRQNQLVNSLPILKFNWVNSSPNDNVIAMHTFKLCVSTINQ